MTNYFKSIFMAGFAHASLQCSLPLLHAICFSVLFLSAATVFGQGAFTSHILERTDTAAPVTPEQVDEWIAQAEKGDWQLMAEFAAAYLAQGNCEKLKFGHRCRAMKVRTEAGRKFLFRIIGTPSDFEEGKRKAPRAFYNNPHLYDIRHFQKEFAQSRLVEASSRESRQKPSPDDPGCKDYLTYMTLAAENRDIYAAQKVHEAYLTGFCTEKDEIKAEYFFQLGYSRPIP